MAERLREILMSDSDDSDFEGFSPSEVGSDVDIPLVSDMSSEDSDSDDDQAQQADATPTTDTDWTSNFTSVRFDDFSEPSGPNLPDGFDVFTAGALDYFWLMFNCQLFDDICQHTNNYARWKIAESGVPDRYWYDTTPQEIRAYIGINVNFGIDKKPEADLYWSSNPFVGNAGIQATMPCNRYQKLTQYFHVADRASEPVRGDPSYDRLFKIRPILTHVATNFKERYTLGREVSIDEAMVRYTGQLSCSQYMPAKPIKRGVKLWMLCDANNAYLSKFDVYLGKQNNTTEHGLGHNVVMKLSEEMHHSHRHVYFDNYFTGVPLLRSLLEKGLYACGTIRQNRKEFPRELHKPRDVKQRGDSKTLQKGTSNLTATVWKDKRLVYTLSTLSDPAVIVDAQRRVGSAIVPIHQPQSVCQYNKYMGGVDLHDQMRMKYDV